MLVRCMNTEEGMNGKKKVRKEKWVTSLCVCVCVCGWFFVSPWSNNDPVTLQGPLSSGERERKNSTLQIAANLALQCTV